jgi:hypothetical protein
VRHGALLAATRDRMTNSFGLTARRSRAFASAILARIDALYEARRALPTRVATAQLLGVGHVESQHIPRRPSAPMTKRGPK